jgi:hypothetical protein
VACCKRDNQIAMNPRQGTSRHDQAAIRGARECGDGTLHLAGPGSYIRVPKDRRKLQQGHDLFEQLEPFRAQAVFEHREAGGVAARPHQTFNEARADWVDEIHEHNRDGAS